MAVKPTEGYKGNKKNKTQEGLNKRTSDTRKQKQKSAPKMPKSAAAMAQRKQDVAGVRKKVKSAAQKVNNAMIKEADRRISNRIQDPTGAKTIAKNINAAKNIRKKTGSATSRNPRKKK